MAEIFTNDPVATLSGAMTAGATTLSVLDGSEFPVGGTFRIRIDDEIMTVSAVSGSTWTVTRASEKCLGVQTAVVHASGATVYGVLTAGALATLVGTVSSVGGANVAGVAVSVASPTTTPVITVTLTNITPTTVAATGLLSGSAVTVTGALTGATLATSGNATVGGSLVVTGAVSGSNLSGTNTGDQTNVTGSSGSCTGNAATATALQTGRTINTVLFDGTANIVVTAAAGTLTGTTINATVVTSSLTSVGTITIGAWTATPVAAQYGGLGADTSGYTSGQIPVAQGAGVYAADGRRGFFSGHGPPAAGLGFPTDYYLDLDTSNIYLKS